MARVKQLFLSNTLETTNQISVIELEQPAADVFPAMLDFMYEDSKDVVVEVCRNDEFESLFPHLRRISSGLLHTMPVYTPTAQPGGVHLFTDLLSVCTFNFVSCDSLLLACKIFCRCCCPLLAGASHAVS